MDNDFGFLDDRMDDVPEPTLLPVGTECKIKIAAMYVGRGRNSGKPYVRASFVVTDGDLKNEEGEAILPVAIPMMSSFISQPADEDDENTAMNKKMRWKGFLSTFGLLEDFGNRGFTTVTDENETVFLCWADTAEKVEGYEAWATVDQEVGEDGVTRNTIKAYTSKA